MILSYDIIIVDKELYREGIYVYKNILAAIPNAEKAPDIFESAVHMAKIHQARLILCHIKHHNYIVTSIPIPDVYVCPNYIEIEEDKKLDYILDCYCKDAKKKGIEQVEVILKYDSNPANIIIDTIVPENDVDLIICGASERKGLFKFLGGEATSIVKNAPCDVFVVKCKPTNEK